MILLMARTPTAGIKTGGSGLEKKVGLKFLKKETEQHLSLRYIKYHLNVIL
jgi:hypothetical protein